MNYLVKIWKYASETVDFEFWKILWSLLLTLDNIGKEFRQYIIFQPLRFVDKFGWKKYLVILILFHFLTRKRLIKSLKILNNSDLSTAFDILNPITFRLSNINILGGKPGNVRTIPIRPDACCGPDLPYQTKIKVINYIMKKDGVWKESQEEARFGKKTLGDIASSCMNNRP